MANQAQEQRNPRYVAYARAHGRDPDAQHAHDLEAWPGGRMAGFVIWIGAQWRAWDALDRFGQKRDGSWHVRCTEEHAAFDAWLATGV